MTRMVANEFFGGLILFALIRVICGLLFLDYHGVLRG